MSIDETIEPLEDDLPEQMRIRQDKRARLIESGKAAYPVTVPVTHTISDIRSSYPDLVAGTETGEIVGIAGRVMFVRNTGRLAFVSLRAGDGAEIQGMLSDHRLPIERKAEA